MLVGGGLVEYFKWQMFQATATTPKQPQWTDKEHYAACCLWADQHSQIARDAGTELHDLIQAYNLARKHQKSVPSPPERWAGQYRSYVGWYEANVAESLAVEEVLMGDGYAGRVDHICLLRDGRYAACDAKTQNLVSKKKFSHYLSWALQLGAYSVAYKKSATPSAIISLVFDPNGSAFQAYEWPEPTRYYAKLFMNLLQIWYAENKYFPRLEEVTP